MEYIYAIEFADQQYYIGRSKHPYERLEQHVKHGNRWIKARMPHLHIWILQHFNAEDPAQKGFYELDWTLRYMEAYGIDKVRGYGWCQPTISDDMQRTLRWMIRCRTESQLHTQKVVEETDMEIDEEPSIKKSEQIIKEEATPNIKQEPIEDKVTHIDKTKQNNETKKIPLFIRLSDETWTCPVSFQTEGLIMRHGRDLYCAVPETTEAWDFSSTSKRAWRHVLQALQIENCKFKYQMEFQYNGDFEQRWLRKSKWTMLYQKTK